MFLKSKIYFTIFVVYEIAAGFLLHYPRTCDAMFGGTFCMSGVFKYFVGLVAVPLLAYVICMWIREIMLAHRRRHSIVYRTKNAVEDMWDSVKDRVSQNITTADIEKYLTAAVLIGIKKYVEKHPKTKNTLNNVIDSLGGDMVEDDEYTSESAARRTTTGASRARTASASNRGTKSAAGTSNKKKR